MTPEQVFVLVFAPVAVGAVLAVVLDAIHSTRLAVAVAAAGLVLGGCAGLTVGWTTGAATAFGVVLTGRVFSTMPGVVFVAAGLALVGSLSEQGGESDSGATAALVSLAALGAALTACAIDMTMLMLALETTAVCSYALIALARTREASEAAMKYLIQGSVATGVGVLGLAALVGSLDVGGGYTGLLEALATVSDATPALAGIVLFVAMLAFKSGAAPFHSWAPDAYQSARPSVSAFLSVGPKIAAGMAIALIAAAFGPAGAGPGAPAGLIGGDILPIIGLLGSLSVLVGSTAAMMQSSYTRMLGYAGVAQVGYALMAASAVNPSAVAVFCATYALGTTTTFLLAVAARNADAEWDGSVAGLAGLGTRSPIAAAAGAVGLVSLAGIPPLAGFWGKFEAIGAAIHAARASVSGGHHSFGWMYAVFAAIAIIGSVVSLGYYGSVLRSMYFETSRQRADEVDARGATPTLILVMVLLAVLILAVGLVPLFTGMSASVRGFLLN